MAYTKPQQRKKEESKRLRGERDQIKFIDLKFERWQVVRFRKARRMDIHCLHISLHSKPVSEKASSFDFGFYHT